MSSSYDVEDFSVMNYTAVLAHAVAAEAAMKDVVCRSLRIQLATIESRAKAGRFSCETEFDYDEVGIAVIGELTGRGYKVERIDNPQLHPARHNDRLTFWKISW